jgi:hypothetical protein
MTAMTLDAARIIDDSPIGEVVLHSPRRITRASALAGYRLDVLTLGGTITSVVREDEFTAQVSTN